MIIYVIGDLNLVGIDYLLCFYSRVRNLISLFIHYINQRINYFKLLYMQSIIAPQIISVNNSYTYSKIYPQSGGLTSIAATGFTFQLGPGVYDIDKTFFYHERSLAISNVNVHAYNAAVFFNNQADYECQGQLQVQWDGVPVLQLQNLTIQQISWYQTQNRIENENARTQLSTPTSAAAGLLSYQQMSFSQAGVYSAVAATTALAAVPFSARYSLRHWLGGYFPDNFKYLVVQQQFQMILTKSSVSGAYLINYQTAACVANIVVPIINQIAIDTGVPTLAIVTDYLFAVSLNYIPAPELMFPTKPIMNQIPYQSTVAVVNQQPVPEGTTCREQYLLISTPVAIGSLTCIQPNTDEITSFVISWLKNNQQQMFCATLNEFKSLLQESNGNNKKYKYTVALKHLWPLTSGFITNNMNSSGNLDFWLAFLSY